MQVFDYVTDPDLIDCYIYEQNAVMKRYKYLLQKAASLKASEQAVFRIKMDCPAAV